MSYYVIQSLIWFNINTIYDLERLVIDGIYISPGHITRWST